MVEADLLQDEQTTLRPSPETGYKQLRIDRAGKYKARSIFINGCKGLTSVDEETVSQALWNFKKNPTGIYRVEQKPEIKLLSFEPLT